MIKFPHLKRKDLLRTHRSFFHPERVRAQDKHTRYYIEYGDNLVIKDYWLYLGSEPIELITPYNEFETFITQDIINTLATFKNIASIVLNNKGQLVITNQYNERVQQIIKINPGCVREHEKKYITTVLKNKESGEARYVTAAQTNFSLDI